MKVNKTDVAIKLALLVYVIGLLVMLFGENRLSKLSW